MHKLAGECYVHGVMDGELFDELRARAFKEEIFVLK
jgi:hypothetical protein